VINKYKVAKHFKVTITNATFQFVVRTARVATEATLDGIYVIRTNVGAAMLLAVDAVRHYKPSVTWNVRFARSRRSTCTSRRFIITSQIGCAVTSSTACWRMTSGGTCGRHGDPPRPPHRRASGGPDWPAPVSEHTRRSALSQRCQMPST
jgi:hypothetical protein